MTTRSEEGRAARLEEAIRRKRAAARSGASRLPPRPEDEPVLLGELQRSLWLLQQLEPHSAAYHLVSAFRVTGELDVASLERALNGLVLRHRLLRSTFRAGRERVLQVVQPPTALRVERLEAARGEARASAVRAARRPFDLEAGPLVRLLLVEEREGGERLLVLLLHHILADERSLAVLWKELAASYRGEGLGEAPPSQYDDYVYWLAGRDPSARAAELDFWRRRLEPLPDELALPFESPAGGERPQGGRLLSLRVESGVRRRIRRVAAAAGTTPFIVFAFAFRLLLHRYAQGQGVAFATPASVRSHPAAAEMIGYFLNPVLITAPIDEERSVERSIRALGVRVRDALAHASTPFDRLVEELSPPRRPGRHPIFQTMFVYQEKPPPPDLGEARLEPISLDLNESKFDLTLFASESPDALEIAVEFRRDRFDELWMHQLLGHYESLLGTLAENLERPVLELPLLTSTESRRIEAVASGPPLDLAESALLPRQILEQARASPQATAIVSGAESWSYADLERAAWRVARELRAVGISPGDRVGLYLDRSPWMLAGLLGSHWAGAAYVPLDPAYPSERNRAVLEDAEVAAVLSRSTLLDEAPSGPANAIAIDTLSEDPPGSGNETSLPELHADLPAYLLYTSGSTGRPKGVVVTQGNLRASNGARFVAYDAPPERFLLLSSISFDSSVAGIFWSLAAGGALVIPTDHEARDPRQLARLVAEREVDSLLCVPSLYDHLLAAGGERLEGLKKVIVAGESCPWQLVEEHFRSLPGTRLFNEYGPTEATVWASLHEMERPVGSWDKSQSVPIGRPIPGVRVEVLDELGRRVPAGVPGEGWISGPTLADGYWRRPELSGERFVERSFEGEPVRRLYRTGDRLSWSADGRLLFLGRADDQIKLRGFRIEPGEIESALLDFSEVEEAVVVPRDGGQLAAFLRTRGAFVDRREALGRRLPDYMVPGRLVELPELPRLPNGKVDRGRLRAMPLEPEAAVDEAGPILGDRERALVSLWEGLLERTGISVSDNFFRLGGHSLLAVEMVSVIERDFGVDLAPAEVFENPTIRELAARIDQRGGPRAPRYAHLFPIQPGGRRSPFIFCIPHFFTEMVARRFRGERPVYGLRGVGLRPEGNRGRWPTLRHLGEELVEEIRRRFPDERYILAGYSFGASMAVEAARLMEERGLEVERLYLIAPMPVDHYRLGPFRVQLDALREPVRELSFAEALKRFARQSSPLSRRPYQRLWRLLAVQPWRRLVCLGGKLRSLGGLPLTPGVLYADVRLERFRLHAGYRPGVVRSPTVFFNAREPETDAAATWRPYFEGPFIVDEIPDPHLDAESIRAARELILERLEELRG